MNKYKVYKVITESFYPEGFNERMHPDIEKQLSEKSTSLGDHPAIPKLNGDDISKKLLLGYFTEVVKNYKRAFDVDEISETDVELTDKSPKNLLMGCMEAESKHRDFLEKLAVEVVCEEFNIPKGSIAFNAKLTDKISLQPRVKNETPNESFMMEFEDHAEMELAEKEVKKRRLINAMVEGCANSMNHSYNNVISELTNIHPSLPNKYAKLMSLNDYNMFKNAEWGKGEPVGCSNVNFDDSDIPTITAEGVIFPILIRELAKGLMEMIAMHGFGDNQNLNDYAVSQADYTSAEPWDIRMGSALWKKFESMVESENKKHKHHIFHSLVKKPVDEFNNYMKEVLAGTNSGRKFISDSILEVSSMMDVDALEETDKNAETTIQAVDRTIKELQDLIQRDLGKQLRLRWGNSWGMKEVVKPNIDAQDVSIQSNQTPPKAYNDGIGNGNVADESLSPIEHARKEAAETFGMNPIAIRIMLSYFDSPNIDAMILGSKYTPERDNMIDVLTTYTDPENGHRTEMTSTHKAANGRMLRRNKLRVWDPKSMEYIK